MLATATICDLTGLSLEILNLWVRRGFIRPIVMGGKGQGNSHLYSGRQAIALAIVAALHRSERGCSPVYAGRVVQMFEDMNDVEISNWLTREGDTGPTPAWIDPNKLMLPGDDSIVETIYHNLAKMEPVARHHLDQPAKADGVKRRRSKAKRV